MTKESVVQKIVQSLSFEVEATPQQNYIHVTSTSKSTPLNVKIKVRKKDDTLRGIISVPKNYQPESPPEMNRLVSSDQTIISFNVIMEADFDKKPLQKSRNKIFNILKPGVCLSTQSEDNNYAYMPSSSYNANMIDGSISSKSDGTLRQDFTLSKMINDSKQTKRQKTFFGKCKPGGCLDPPFSEDKYVYEPKPLKEQSSIQSKSNNKSLLKIDKILSEKNSILENNVLQQKYESKEDKLGIQVDQAKIVSVESMQNSTTYSNSIITYPPDLMTNELLGNQEKRIIRGSIDNRSKKSFNDTQDSGSYYMLPKKGKKVSELFLINKNNNSRVSHLEEIEKAVDLLTLSKQGDLLTTNTIKKPSNVDVQVVSKENEVLSMADLRKSDPQISLQIVDRDKEYLNHESLQLRNETSDRQSRSKISNNEIYNMIVETKIPCLSKQFETQKGENTPAYSNILPDETKVIMTEDITDDKEVKNIDQIAKITSDLNKDNRDSPVEIKMSTYSIKEQELKTKTISNVTATSSNNMKKDSIVQKNIMVSQAGSEVVAMHTLSMHSSSMGQNHSKATKSEETKILQKVNSTVSYLNGTRTVPIDQDYIPFISNTIDAEMIPNKSKLSSNKSLENVISQQKTISKYDYNENFLQKLTDTLRQSASEIGLNQEITSIGSKSTNFDNLYNKEIKSREESNDLQPSKNITYIKEVSSSLNNLQKESYVGDANEYKILNDLSFESTSLRNSDIILESPKYYSNEIKPPSVTDSALTDNQIKFYKYIQNDIEQQTFKNNIKEHIDQIDDSYPTQNSIIVEGDLKVDDVNAHALLEKEFEQITPIDSLQKSQFNNIDNADISDNFTFDPIDECDGNHNGNEVANNETINIVPETNISDSSEINTIMTDKISMDNIKTPHISIDENQTPNKFSSKERYFEKLPPLSGDNVETNIYSGSIIQSQEEKPIIDSNNLLTKKHSSLILSKEFLRTNVESSYQDNTIKQSNEDLLPKTSDRFKSKSNTTLNDIEDSNSFADRKLSITNNNTSLEKIKNEKESSIQTYVQTKFVPEKIHPESQPQSTKKDYLSLDLAFQIFTNKNEKSLKCFDRSLNPMRYPDDKIIFLKTHISSRNDINIPIDSETQLSMQISRLNKPNVKSYKNANVIHTYENNQSVRNNHSVIWDEKTVEKLKQADNYKKAKNNNKSNKIDTLVAIYEQELIPLQQTIKQLKDEIDKLNGEKLIVRDILYNAKIMKSSRLKPVIRKCGCLRK